MDPLTISLGEHAGWTVVRAVGAIDVSTAPKLRQSLQETQFGGADRVVVDLDGVEFLDSFGLGVLVGALKRARSRDGDLALRCTRDRLRQLLALTGLDTLVRVVADLDELAAA